jgi:tetratricopeptide (TPR) repeat protein
MRCTSATLTNLAVRRQLLVISLLIAATAAAQSGASRGGVANPVNSPSGPTSGILSHIALPNTAALVINVFSGQKGTHLDRQALLKLVNLSTQAVTWQTTEGLSRAVFFDLSFGNYAVEVSAVGYLGDHKEVHIDGTAAQVENDLILERDPDAVNLDVDDRMMSAKVRKEAKRAISDLKSGHLKEAQKQLDQAYKLSPSSPELNFLFGYLYFEKKDFSQATSYLTKSITLDPRNIQALSLLGRTQLERENYPAAQSVLEQAVALDGENWLAHDLLANACLRQKNYDRARAESEIAIAKGGSPASSAQIVLGQALANTGHIREGIEALNTFLEQSPHHAMAEQVRVYIANLRDYQNESPEPKSGPSSAASQPESSSIDSESTTRTLAHLVGIDPLTVLPAARLTPVSWQPPGIDDVKLAVAAGVTCPSDHIIDAAGESVQELVANVTRFSAIEDLLHESLDKQGYPVRSQTRHYNYVASIYEPQPGFLAVDEFRTERLAVSDYPDNIASTGFAALALVFHPHMREAFEFSCEGLGDWHGQPNWLVHFRQRPDRPNRMHSYKVGAQDHAVSLKGRAWITADKFQIVRIEAEMVQPMPEIQLLSEHQLVEYGPIPFPQKNTSLWLPKSAELYFDFRKHRYHRRHSFDHYMLFSVDTEEKRKEPGSKSPAKAKTGL